MIIILVAHQFRIIFFSTFLIGEVITLKIYIVSGRVHFFHNYNEIPSFINYYNILYNTLVYFTIREFGTQRP